MMPLHEVTIELLTNAVDIKFASSILIVYPADLSQLSEAALLVRCISNRAPFGYLIDCQYNN